MAVMAAPTATEDTKSVAMAGADIMAIGMATMLLATAAAAKPAAMLKEMLSAFLPKPYFFLEASAASAASSFSRRASMRCGWWPLPAGSLLFAAGGVLLTGLSLLGSFSGWFVILD